jgi:polysaccharide export outer membrane protein
MGAEQSLQRTAAGQHAARALMPLIVACAAAALAGCVSTHDQLSGFVRAHEQSVSTGQYLVMPPDAVMINAPVAPEVDGVTARVRPDGKISLRLVGEVDVAGLTTEQIAEKVRTQLARYYVEPEVVVGVAQYASQFYFVFGQVAAPGRKPFTGRDTLLAALADARPNNLAWRAQVRVVRPSPDTNERKAIIVDLEHMIASGEVDQDFLLQPGDVIEVPPTPLAWLGLRVRDLLFPVEPIIDAYDKPTDPINATHTYRDEWGNNDEGEDHQWWRR